MKSAFFRALALLVVLGVPLSMLRADEVAPVPAPAWKLKDPDGNVVSSDQFKGKVVVLDFWATWCPPCKAEIPGYIKLQKKYEADGLVIIGVSVDQGGPGVVKKFVKDYGVNYTVVMADDAIQSAYEATEAIPTTYIIDREGKIRNRKVGRVPTDEYEQQILAVLKPGSK
jgi:peroxiredoxin